MGRKKKSVKQIEELGEKVAEQTITDEELRAFVDLMEAEGQLDGLWDTASLAIIQTEDTPKSFGLFFELMHGTPLHSEGVKWIHNAYKAHTEAKGLAEECHRESGKTTVFSKFFLAFRIGKEPHKVNSVIRINDDKANETTKAVAHIIEHDPRWKVIFPHVVPDKESGWGADGYNVKRADVDKEEWAKIKTESPDGPTFVGYGWKSGSIIGSRFNGVVIVDDIHDEENTSSDRMLKKVIKFYTDTLKFCIMRGAREIWNFTPWTPNDVYAYILNTGEYLHSKTPVMVEAEEGDEGATYWEPTPLNREYPEAGNIPLSGRWWKLYWPEQWDFERIGTYYRTAGVLGFARMMLLDLEAAKGINLKREWLHEYPASDINPSWPVFFGIDYASTRDKLKDKERDYFTLAILRAIPGGGLVLVDGHKARISKGEALNSAMSYWMLYPTLQRMGVEDIGKGEEFYTDLMLMQDAIGRVPPLMPVKHGRKSKGDRFENWLAPRFQMSRIWVSDVKTTFIKQFEEEWLLWPNAAFDDCLDGVYMGAFAAEGFMPSKAERSFKKEKEPNPFLSLGRSYG